MDLRPVDLRRTKTTLLQQGHADEKREEIRQYFHATFSLDEQLYETLATEQAFYLRPEPLRHPLIFYIGHTATFYINKLIVAKITNQRIHPRFESMFAVGKDHPLYGWDNEFGHQEHDVWDFAASRYLVSNREYLDFVEDQGYAREENWTHEGWQWVGFSQAQHPLFWVETPSGYQLRTMAQIIDMPWDWPVEVNNSEAKAFCDIIGNAWQWTETPITGFDGFQFRQVRNTTPERNEIRAGTAQACSGLHCYTAGPTLQALAVLTNPAGLHPMHSPLGTCL